mmetsp:Transcript_13661/g.21339  ORF Transcript_13661/g.21339 Transcript_13661/m.21339 type:complete len:150 (-) Transcript_13661:74-523(-)
MEGGGSARTSAVQHEARQGLDRPELQESRVRTCEDGGLRWSFSVLQALNKMDRPTFSEKDEIVMKAYAKQVGQILTEIGASDIGRENSNEQSFNSCTKDVLSTARSNSPSFDSLTGRTVSGGTGLSASGQSRPESPTSPTAHLEPVNEA